MSNITVHMIVKNEDQWVWFALQSVLPFADQILLSDTGSTDKTLDIIKSISSPKIHFSQVIANTAQDITAARTAQLKQTKTPWIWVVDGDEIYPETTAKECISAIESGKYEGILVRRYDLLGDIYHRQLESVGSYQLFGQTGHLLVRLINKDKIPGLAYQGDYPNEGFVDGHGDSILTHNPRTWYTTTDYLYHAMYLKRSSLGSNLPMFNRGKYKIETGMEIGRGGVLPSAFYMPRPSVIPDPLAHRGTMYEVAAKIITPIKNLKRKII